MSSLALGISDGLVAFSTGSKGGVCPCSQANSGLMAEMNPNLHPIDSSLENVSLYVSLSMDFQMDITKEIDTTYSIRSREYL